ncbi:hypothetical protein VSR01_08955 [Actinacidiphila sp. DG2A-62]|nr:hypothetical protein [Actinacidiphila sp. DG2A-62]MEC3993657.1 hypothetical protein [Actinacidiphila sp. DG2A-62]
MRRTGGTGPRARQAGPALAADGPEADRPRGRDDKPADNKPTDDKPT